MVAFVFTLNTRPLFVCLPSCTPIFHTRQISPFQHSPHPRMRFSIWAIWLQFCSCHPTFNVHPFDTQCWSMANKLSTYYPCQANFLFVQGIGFVCGLLSCKPASWMTSLIARSQVRKSPLLRFEHAINLGNRNFLFLSFE